MKKTLLTGFLLYAIQAVSQVSPAPVLPSTLNMGGGSAAITSSFIVDWSIGESTIIETFNGKNSFSNSIVGIHWNVTSGILQPFDNTHLIYNFLVPGWTSQEIRFYPMPTPGVVFIDFRSSITGKVTIQVYDREARLIGTKEFTQISGSSTQSWNLSNQSSGVYLFRILLSSYQGVVLKHGTFKVEKNK